MSPSTPQPPEHLSEPAKALYRAIVPKSAKSAGRIALLVAALEARDRAEEARAAIAAHGLVTITPKTKMAHVNPLVRIERENRQLFAKIFGQLNLDWRSDIDGRV